MEYAISKLSKMSGVSTRTLRYYDEIGLLKPARVASSGYRIYGSREVDMLQQILFYRELEFSLEDIKKLLRAPEFDKEKAFAEHLIKLQRKRRRLDLLIENVKKSASAMKGETIMSDNEKFEGFKQKLIDENERNFGAEIRAKYGDESVNQSNTHLMGLTKEQHNESVRLCTELETALKAAFDSGDPAGKLAREACDLHRQWLCIMAPKYDKQYHKSLGELYVLDDRFRANYDKIAPGCTDFFRDAINIYCAE